jgi:hypothetical protein
MLPAHTPGEQASEDGIVVRLYTHGVQGEFMRT